MLDILPHQKNGWVTIPILVMVLLVWQVMTTDFSLSQNNYSDNPYISGTYCSDTNHNMVKCDFSEVGVNNGSES